MHRGDTLQAILARLADESQGHATLWRGSSPQCRDIDVLVPDAHVATVCRVLAAAGFSPPGSRPWGGWDPPDRSIPPIDIMPAGRWPARYQPVAGVLSRRVTHGPLPVAASEDRLLVFAGDALAGRELRKLSARAAAVVAEDPSSPERAHVVARRHGLLGHHRLLMQ